jgi:hypothetical protein
LFPGVCLSNSARHDGLIIYEAGPKCQAPIQDFIISIALVFSTTHQVETFLAKVHLDDYCHPLDNLLVLRPLFQRPSVDLLNPLEIFATKRAIIHLLIDLRIFITLHLKTSHPNIID